MWLRRTGGCICAYRGGSFPIPILSVRLRVVKRQFTFDPLDKKWLRERLRVCRGEARNQLRGLKEGGSARRGAMLCLSADLTTHALPLFKQAFYPVLKDMKMGGKDDGVKVFNAAKYGSVKVFIVVQERRASRSPSWRRSAAKDGKVTLTDPLDQLCGNRR